MAKPYRPVQRRYRQLRRCFQLADALRRETGAKPLSRLARQFGVSTRTIRRDLAALRVIGVIRVNFTEADIVSDVHV